MPGIASTLSSDDALCTASESRLKNTPAYCAVALAGLGDLPDTILTRSVVVRMRRRAPTERIEPYRRRDVQSQADALRARIEAWAASVFDDMAAARPYFPCGVEDRDADVWEALLAVADAAGGAWPRRARDAAEALVAQSKNSTPSLGVRLLADMRPIFGAYEKMPTDAILKALHAMDEAPWADIRGKPLDARGLANRLKPYGITSKQVRIGAATMKGYERADLADAWQRYLSLSPQGGETAETPETSGLAVPDVSHVSDARYERDTDDWRGRGVDLMGARELLAEAAGVGLSVRAEGGRLPIRPASKLTVAMRSALIEAKPELLALPTPKRPHKLTPAQSDAAHAEPWDDAAWARIVARVALFMRRGIDATDSDDLAERLHLRDAEGDNRRMCLECVHLSVREAGA